VSERAVTTTTGTAHPPQGPAALQAVDPRKHEVDQHDVGGSLSEGLEPVLARRRLIDLVALVLEGEAHRGADALVVLDEEEAAGHTEMVSHRRGLCQAILPGRPGTAARIVTQPKYPAAYPELGHEG
jgi:hypothetical protein